MYKLRVRKWRSFVDNCEIRVQNQNILEENINSLTLL